MGIPERVRSVYDLETSNPKLIKGHSVVAKGYEPDFGDYRRIVQHAT